MRSPKWRRPLSALLLVAAGCTGSSDPQPEPAVVQARPYVVVEPAPEAPSRSYPLIRPAEGDPRHPPEPYVDRGVCPFECCVYREWIAHAPIRAYARERDTTSVAFTLAEGERFQALTGNVHLDTIGVAVVRRPVTWKEGPDSIGRFEPGDTVYVLSYLGEDHFRMWHRGRIVEDFRFWPYTDERPSGAPEGVLLREPREDWWAQVRNAAGQVGWLHMSADGDRVGHKDACSVD